MKVNFAPGSQSAWNKSFRGEEAVQTTASLHDGQSVFIIELKEL